MVTLSAMALAEAEGSRHKAQGTRTRLKAQRLKKGTRFKTLEFKAQGIVDIFASAYSDVMQAFELWIAER
jgi:hypothetical protein